jgi:PAS domain S-box-containing protein
MPIPEPAEPRQKAPTQVGKILSTIDATPINILIVDDEPKNLTVLESLLDAPGYRLVRAESADQALLALVAEEFALLILDVRMPGMTGFELAQIIKGRKKTAQVPIIFLTAYYNEDQHILEGYGSGAVDYLHKPVNAPILKSKVAIFAELHRKGREVTITNRTLLAEVTERRRVEEQLRELNEQLDRRVADRTEALRSSDARLRLATDAVQLAIWAWQPVEDTWIWENDWALSVFGLAHDQSPASAESLRALVMPEDHAAFDAATSRTRRGQPFRFEGRILQPQGGTRWIELDGNQVEDSDGKGHVLGTIRDTTDRRQAELALRDSEARYRTLFHSIDEGFCVLRKLSGDPGDERPDFIFAECNQAFQKHSGLDGVEGQSLTTVIPAIEPQWLDDFAHVAATGDSLRREGELKALGRFVEIHAFSLDGAGTDRIAILFRDVTERVRSEEALRERERFLRTVTSAARIGLAVIEPGETFRFANDSIAHMLELPVHAIVGRPVSAVMGSAWALARPHVQLAFAGQRVSFEFALDANATSTTRHFGAFLEPHVDQDGARTVAIVMIEITELKRLESELRETDRRKDEFLATLAHELRNPLAPVRNAVQILNLRASLNKEVTWASSVIERQVRVMVRLIDDLMDVTRINQGRIELRRDQVELSDVLALAIESSRPQIDEFGHQLVLAQPDAPIFVDADLTRLSQVFMNLITNAAKYTDKGGRIEVRVERQDTQVRIDVLDNGIGIAASQLASVFNMFSQVETALARSRGGLGIGLSLAKRLVQMHEGTIEATSDGPGLGSVFSVLLPVPDRRGGTPQAEATALHTSDTASLRVLVVDDNIDGADSLSQLLALAGHQVRTAYDGLEALVAADAFRPDVILLDIGMPRLNGYDACKRIRAEAWGRGVTIIATTGWGDAAAKQSAIEAGFDLHFVKPLDEALVARTLSEIRPGEVGSWQRVPS